MSYSELEAVNFLLSHVGAAPVANLNVDLPDIVSAQLRLNEASIWVQKKGWWFNRLIRQVYEPDGSDEVVLPDNTLKVIGQWPQFVIEREGKAYNPYEDSYEWDINLCLDIILLLEWDALPPSAQDAIMYRAAVNMIIHELEDSNKAQLVQGDAQESYVLLKQEDLQVRQRSVFTTPAFQRLMYRVRPYKRYNLRNPTFPGGGF